MSRVTNVILSMSICEDERARIADVNAAIVRTDAGTDRFPEKGIHHYGLGIKQMDRPTWVIAFNYLDVEALCTELVTIEWRCPDHVQLLACEEHESRYTQRYPEMAQETVEQLILERDALVRAGQNANEAVGEVRGLEADLETERARANIAATNLEFLRDEFKKLMGALERAKEMFEDISTTFEDKELRTGYSNVPERLARYVEAAEQTWAVARDAWQRIVGMKSEES